MLTQHACTASLATWHSYSTASLILSSHGSSKSKSSGISGSYSSGRPGASVVIKYTCGSGTGQFSARYSFSQVLPLAS